MVIPFPKDASNLSYAIQRELAQRYAVLIENYLLYGEQAPEGRTPETQAFIIAYAAETNKNS